ncbi:proprotein convertase P-domain-containing protein [Devosia sp.]|uniref:peptidoglycan-binding domain-containing protein n=1 Tax=Devosia sp. TaxID=1871048 RepID=UPI003BAA7290
MKRSVSVIIGLCLMFFGTIDLAAAEQPGIRCVQNQLNALGFSLGTADGTIGGKTRTAAEAYRAWMSGGAGEPGWSQPPLTALNGEFWCEKVGQAHPEVAKYAVVASGPRYEVSPGEMLASFEVPTTGKITKWKLFFEFKTQCENDHRITLVSPSGRSLTVMERGLNRCSGRTETFTSDNTEDNGVFVGTTAQGVWKLRFQDLDANKYTGALTKVRMELAIADGDATTKYVVVLKGLPKKVPNPE